MKNGDLTTMNLIFKPKTHQYFLDDKEIPSVSVVIDSICGNIYSKIPDDRHYLIDQAGQFGTHVHSGIQMALMNQLDWDTVDDVLKPCIEGALLFIKDFDILFDDNQLEQQLVSEKHFFAGTIDLIGYSYLKRENVIVDWKTANSLNQERIEYQLNAYHILAEENYGISRYLKYVVQLPLSGGYKLYPCNNILYKRKFIQAINNL